MQPPFFWMHRFRMQVARCSGTHLRISDILSKQRFVGVDVESAAVCALRHFLPVSSPLKLQGIADGLALVTRALAKHATLNTASARAQTKRIIVFVSVRRIV